MANADRNLQDVVPQELNDSRVSSIRLPLLRKRSPRRRAGRGILKSLNLTAGRAAATRFRTRAGMVIEWRA
jgi:hypothetical protein